MDGAVIAQWAATGIIGIALIVTWVKNGRSQAEKFGRLEGSVKGLSDRIENLETQTGSLSQRIDSILNHLPGRK